MPSALRASAAPILAIGVLCVVGAGAAWVALGGGLEGGVAVLVVASGWALTTALVLHAHRATLARLARLQALAAGLREGAPPTPDEASSLGEDAAPLLELAEEAARARAERDDAVLQAQALLHLGPHYALVLGLDGTLIEANPAFWARTGLTPAAVRRDPGLLQGLLPLPTVLDLAERSLRENVGFSGVPLRLALAGEDRAVSLSLRAVPAADGDVAVLLLADQSHQRDLEQQVDQFTDALELMVDQRVIQITAGRDALEEMLEEAGLPVFVFDRNGAVERMNAAAERLTGRTQFTLRQFGQVAAVLSADEPGRDALHAWFWQGGGRPAVTSVPAPQGAVPMGWHTAVERRGGEAVRRLLVGAPLPEAPVADGGDPIRRLDALAATIAAGSLPADSRPYVEVIREAVRRIERGATGDGASIRTLGAPR